MEERGVEGMAGDAGDPDQALPDLADLVVDGQQLLHQGDGARRHGLGRAQQQALDEAVNDGVRDAAVRVGVQVDDLRPVPFRDYHRQGAEHPALRPGVVA